MEDEMNTNNTEWTEYFGSEASAVDVCRAAEESNITVADYLHLMYLDMFASNPSEMAENVDFDKLGEQVTSEAMQDETFAAEHAE
jgi:hypothetical protein